MRPMLVNTTDAIKRGRETAESGNVVEMRGLEPLTSALQRQRSSS